MAKLTYLLIFESFFMERGFLLFFELILYAVCYPLDKPKLNTEIKSLLLLFASKNEYFI